MNDCDICNYKWITITNKQTRNSSKPMSSLTRHISTVITISNRFVLLSNLKNALIIANIDDKRREIASKKCAILSKKKHKIIILGDSYVKACLRFVTVFIVPAV